MTKKAFEALAKWLRTTKPGEFDFSYRRWTQWYQDVEAVIQASKEVNPRFDTERFKEACGYND